LFWSAADLLVFDILPMAWFVPVLLPEGPIFPKAIADVIGSSRDAVQKLVAKLVANGSVARVTGGYVAVAARIVEDAEGAIDAETGGFAHSAHSVLARTHTRVPAHSTHSPRRVDGGRGRGHAYRAGARDGGPVLGVVPAARPVRTCLWYRDHQSNTARSGWTCDACYPRRNPIA
jgi:hypothetical protein